MHTSSCNPRNVRIMLAHRIRDDARSFTRHVRVRMPTLRVGVIPLGARFLTVSHCTTVQCLRKCYFLQHWCQKPRLLRSRTHVPTCIRSHTLHVHNAPVLRAVHTLVQGMHCASVCLQCNGCENSIFCNIAVRDRDFFEVTPTHLVVYVTLRVTRNVPATYKDYSALHCKLVQCCRKLHFLQHWCFGP